jgi:integrase
MARTIRDARLETRAARLRLPPGRKAHVRTLVPRVLALGYRRKRDNEPGTWLARTYIGRKRYRVAPLGLADDFQDADGSRVLTFAEAQRAALAAAPAAGKGGLTVAEAIATYLAWMRTHRASVRDAEARANKLILPELGSMKVADLTTAKLCAWRDRLAERPALARTRAGAEQRYKATRNPRARRASTNRVLTILKAALNKAFREGDVDDDLAWRRVKPFGQTAAARPSYLSIDEATRLLDAADPAFRRLVRGALETGARYGELRAARVGDYARGKLHIPRSKSGKARDAVLSENAIAFFDTMTAGRDRNAPMFVKGNGAPWGPSEQTRQMIAACKRAELPPVGFHALRHTYASHAVMRGMPLMVLARNLGHASTVMIERHYGHLSESYVDEIIKQTAPRFAA